MVIRGGQERQELLWDFWLGSLTVLLSVDEGCKSPQVCGSQVEEICQWGNSAFHIADTKILMLENNGRLGTSGLQHAVSIQAYFWVMHRKPTCSSRGKARWSGLFVASRRDLDSTEFLVCSPQLLTTCWTWMEWASHAFWHHIHIIPNDENFRDVVAFAYCSRLKPKVLRSTEKPSAPRSLSRKESDNERPDEAEMDKWKLDVSEVPAAKDVWSYIDLEWHEVP